MKRKDFTVEEMEFLFKNIERGKFMFEKERIELISITDKIEYKTINGKIYPYLIPSFESDLKQKAKILKAITECDDFGFDYYGDGECILVTYKLQLEPYEIYIERLNTEGRMLIIKERLRLTRKSRQETRMVLIEKFKKKKKKIFRRIYSPDMLLDYDFFHRGA